MNTPANTTSLSQASPPASRVPRSAVVALVFVVLAVLPLFVGRGHPAFRTFSITFVSIVLEALPFVMLGSLLGGLVEVFLSRERVAALIPRNRHLAICAAGLLGIVAPVCECAVVPVTRRLIGKGVPFSAAIGYLLAGPIVNPIVATSTAVAYSWNLEVVAIRMAGGYLIAVITAFVMDRLVPGTAALRPDFAKRLGDPHNHSHVQSDSCGCDHDCHGPAGNDTPAGRKPALGRRVGAALGIAADDFIYVGQFLIIGAMFAALTQTLIDRQALLALGNTTPLSVILMMLLAILLNLCSEADAFVAASFQGVMPLASQMAFMLLGPMLDIKLVAMYLSFVRKRAFIALAALVCGFVFSAAMLLAIFFRLGGR